MMKSAVTRETLESILGEKLKPINTKTDSVIESINFWERKFDEMNKRIAEVECSSGQIHKKKIKLLKDEFLILSYSL